MKFKYSIGDKVISKHGYSFDGEPCVITRIFESDRLYFIKPCSSNLKNEYAVPEDNITLINSSRNNKIVITTDGTTTLARLYDGNKVVKSAEAKCSPDDTYDFATGANLAYDRLMRPAAKPEPAEPVKLYCVKSFGAGEWVTKGKIYEIDTNGDIHFDDGYSTKFSEIGKSAEQIKHLVPLVKRPAKVGEWVYISKSHSERFIGTIGKVIDFVDKQPKINHNRVWFSLNPDGTENAVLSVHTEYLVLDGYKPEEPAKEEPKGWSGKAVCIKTSDGALTAGKVYSIKNGHLKWDDGEVWNQVFESIASLNAHFGGKTAFINFKGEQA